MQWSTATLKVFDRLGVLTFESDRILECQSGWAWHEIGRGASVSRGRALLLATLYVVGMGLMFAFVIGQALFLSKYIEEPKEGDTGKDAGAP